MTAAPAYCAHFDRRRREGQTSTAAPRPPPPRIDAADARETVQFGLLGMLMHGAKLDSAPWLAAFDGYQALQFFGVDVSGA